MRLVRYLLGGEVYIGALQEGGIVELSAVAPEYTQIRQLTALDPVELARVAAKVAETSPTVSLQIVRLLAPIERPGKYLAIGMNYGKHAEEAHRLGAPTLKQQMWFNKQTSCITGPFDDIDPGASERLDYEVELGVVIGRPARRVRPESSPSHVFGYFVANDVSARDWQAHSPTITIGKSFDTYGPIGPCIVTADEIADPHNLSLRCYVNGAERQNGNTHDMIFNIWEQVAYLSRAFTLESGDLLATGTPEGVGAAMIPPRFLQRGDEVRCEIDSIGALVNEVI